LLNSVIQAEPGDAIDPDTLGLFAAIGIEKGKPFEPDARMKKLLTDAAAVGDATARTLAYQSRMKEAFFYPNSAWITPFIGGSYKFEQNGFVNLDAKSMFFFYATGVTPAMTLKMVGEGSQYAGAFVDAKGNPLDGSKTYSLHMPPNVPAKDFWSFTLYDNQTRSMLQTDQQSLAVGSLSKGLVTNADGSVCISGQRLPLARKQIGSRRSPAKAGALFFASLRSARTLVQQNLAPGRDRTDVVILPATELARRLRRECSDPVAIVRHDEAVQIEIEAFVMATPDRVPTRRICSVCRAR
jgi:hypothetical protein